MTPPRDRIRAAIVAAFFVCGGLLPGTPRAGDFQVSPIRVELSSKRSNDALTIQNNGSEAIVIQMQTVAWSQDRGHDVYQPSDDLVATPPIFTVQPGGKQIVRVGLLRSVDDARELSYRLFLQEVPSKPKPDFKGLQMLLRIGLPVFVSPKAKASPALRWSAGRTDGNELEVSLTNDGNAHIQVSEFKLSLPGKPQAIAAQQASAYLLPGQSRNWTLATDPAQRWASDMVRINADTDAGTVETDIKLEKR